VETVRPEVRTLVLRPDGEALPIYTDPVRTSEALRTFSARDATAFPEFHSTIGRLGRAIAPLLSNTPPDIENPKLEDLANLGKFGLRFRRLHKKDAYRLLRWAPMAVADLAAEWFETEMLRAAVESQGVCGSFAGPWSAGTAAGLLMQAAFGEPVWVRGGIGALTMALAKAAAAAGAQIRTSAAVTRIIIEHGHAKGVILQDGQEIPARAVISNADPQQTFLKLVDPTELDPGFVVKVGAYRSNGCVAKVNMALSGLPSLPQKSGQILIGQDTDYLERAFDAAKYGDFSPHPFLRITMPSVADSSLAPAPGHVMSVFVQYAPYRLKGGDWDSRREELGDVVLKTLCDYAPGIDKLVVQRQILTPLDIERRFGMSGGHIYHGEHALDQLFTFRPLLGFARYRTPVKGLYLCGSGTHPGGGITGAPGLNAAREILKDVK
jgi:phytoene dehydrogenase-like protein